MTSPHTVFFTISNFYTIWPSLLNIFPRSMSDSEDPNHYVGSDSKPRWEHNKLDWPSPNVAIYICFLLKLCTYQNRMYGIQVIRDPSQNPTYRYWILKSTVHVNFGEVRYQPMKIWAFRYRFISTVPVPVLDSPFALFPLPSAPCGRLLDRWRLHKVFNVRRDLNGGRSPVTGRIAGLAVLARPRLAIRFATVT